MGEVYRARDTRLERDVAVKVLPADLFGDEVARRRFRKEALSLSRLNHPNIGMVFDFDSHEGIDFLVMELIPGETLLERLARGRIPEAEVARVGEQLAEGLAAAHAQGVIHRDIKPANVRITPEGRVKLLDFGLAQAVSVRSEPVATSTLTAEGMVVGTVPYMSPEQLRGERLDGRSDMFSLGALLYEIATGQRPFPQESQPLVITAILGEAPTAPRRIRGDLTAELERIVLKCLEKERAERYQTAADLATDLRRLGRPDAPAARRPVSRRKILRLVAGVCAAALVAAAAALLALDAGGIRGRLFPQAAVAATPSLAVLPLANLSGDPGQEYFADGMTDELITRLAQVASLKVISRASSMQYKGTRKTVAQIARELGVRMLIQGTVQRVGGQVRIRAQLVEAATDRNLWAESFQSSAGDVFAIQAGVARAVVERIRAHLTPDDRARLERAQAVSPEAHEAYLRGRYAAGRLDAGDLGRAVEFFNQAVRLEPGYAQAWAGLAEAYFGLSTTFLSTSEMMPKVRAAASRALALDPSLAEAHVQLSTVAAVYDRDFKTAERELQEAIRLGPNSSEAHGALAGSLQARGDLDRAQAEYDRALELDPLSNMLANYSIWCMYLRGRYDEAIARLDDLARLAPDDAQTWFNLGQCYVQKRDYTQAIADLEKAVHLADGPWPLGMLGHAYAVAGRTGEARAVLEKMNAAAKASQVPAYAFAMVYAGLGDRDRCFEWLEKAYASHDENLPNIKVDPTLASLRGDPRFADLVRRLGLPQ